MRQVRFTASARKHRIGKARALQAMERAGEPLAIPATEGLDQRLLFIGDDDRGGTLEVIAEPASGLPAGHPRNAVCLPEEERWLRSSPPVPTST